MLTPQEIYRKAVAKLLDSSIDKRLIYALTDYIDSLERRMDNPDANVLLVPTEAIMKLAYGLMSKELEDKVHIVLSYMDERERALLPPANFGDIPF